ncbi:glycosyltransferase [Ekhidna sp.]|uniref:glycosyltransferase n=1 Tax=Ekhidna sp. TaxID=2608089 RepID=UPI003299AB93
MNQLPLVSVVCLCHNHLSHLRRSIQSVLSQSYPYVELIVVDDGSTDGSKEMIQAIIEDKNIQYIDIPSSIGNCTAFNLGFEKTKGAYIIDLAADDVLLPERIMKGINSFLNSDAGVTFCDVMNLDENGVELGTHFKRNRNDVLIENVPEGDIYVELIERYFISPPGMMIKREVIEELSGYDESLSYEDFDFWIRSSRNWQYSFTDDVLVQKRKLSGSLSEQQFRYKSKHQKTTLKVCQKIKELNRSGEEKSALRRRCLYEMRQCIRQGNFRLIPEFLKLL